MIVKIKDTSFRTFPPKKRQPKKAQTKAKERFATGAKRTPHYLRSVLDTAIERGERLEKIVELSGVWLQKDGYSGATALRLLKQIYKLAKGA